MTQLYQWNNNTSILDTLYNLHSMWFAMKPIPLWHTYCLYGWTNYLIKLNTAYWMLLPFAENIIYTI